MHNEEEDRRKEREAIDKSGGVDGLVVMPPSVEIKQVWLVTTAVKAEYLPVMDATIIGGAGGGDFFFQVRRVNLIGRGLCRPRTRRVGNDQRRTTSTRSVRIVFGSKRVAMGRSWLM